MSRLLEFVKKSIFFIRVISGHQEREFRSDWLRVEQRLRMLEHAREKIEVLRKGREKKLLLELRRMIEDMQEVAKKFDKIEAVNEAFLNHVDNQARIIKGLQDLLGEEERKMNELIENHRQITRM